MRTLWKGAISFGLVNIPVKMYTAVEEKDIHFKYLHSTCRAPVKYEKHCTVCGTEVPSEEIVMGYEYEKGRYVILNEEDFRRIPSEGSKTIDILDFVDLSEIDPIYFDRSYFLEASAGGEKAYVLLKKAMSETGKIAIARVMIRSKYSLACLRVQEGVVIMETMYYPDEIRSAASLAGVANEPQLHENEVKMAIDLVRNLSGPFEPGKYRDDYREQLMEMIQAKIAGEEVAVPAAAAEGGKVVDLVAALKASLAATAAKAKVEETEKPKRRKAKTG